MFVYTSVSKMVDDLGHMIDGLETLLRRHSQSSSNITAPHIEHRRSSSFPNLTHGVGETQVSIRDLKSTNDRSEWSLIPPSISNLASEGRTGIFFCACTCVYMICVCVCVCDLCMCVCVWDFCMCVCVWDLYIHVTY